MDALLLRSWRPFFDYRFFGLPSSLRDLKERLRENPKFYAANYAFVGGFLCLLECLIYHPFIVFLTSIGLLLGAWFSFSDLPLHVGSVFITPFHKSIIMTLLGLLSMYLTGSARPLLYVSGAWVIMVLLHAAFRTRSAMATSSNSSSNLNATAGSRSPSWSNLNASGRSGSSANFSTQTSPSSRSPSSSNLSTSGKRLNATE